MLPNHVSDTAYNQSGWLIPRIYFLQPLRVGSEIFRMQGAEGCQESNLSGRVVGEEGCSFHIMGTVLYKVTGYKDTEKMLSP